MSREGSTYRKEEFLAIPYSDDVLVILKLDTLQAEVVNGTV